MHDSNPCIDSTDIDAPPRTPRQRYAAWAKSNHGLEARSHMYRRQRGICLCCAKAVPLGQCEIDHYIPLTQPGVNPLDEANMYVVCKGCNRKKGPRKAMYRIQVEERDGGGVLVA